MMKVKSIGDMKMFSLIKNDSRFIEIEYDLIRNLRKHFPDLTIKINFITLAF